MTAMMGAKAAPTVGKTRLIAACTIGNALEFYDFVIYSFFAATIGALFFPSENPTVQLLLSFATYGVGFFLRPLGGMILGSYADRKGRKAATILTLFLMALGTGMIGLAPTYADIGVYGPMLVVLGRLIQGFSAGGEIGASTTLLAECAPPAERGFFGSWQLASQGIAVMVAAGLALSINTLLTPEQVQDWGWRVPFLLGVMIVPVGLWLRRALKETHANEANEQTKKVSAVSVALKAHLSKITVGVAVIIGGTAANAVIVLYMSTYAIRQLGMAPTTALLAGITAGFVTFAVAPLAGALTDRIGRKVVIATAYALIALLIYPAFLVLNAFPTVETLLAVVIVLGALNAAGAAPVILTTAEIFPVEVRATGMSLVYALGVAVFGGFGQFIVTWLIAATGSPLAPAWYVTACCICSLVALRALPETSRIKLT
ncbi:MFS transporter [Rhodobacteraceae bacterium HSP-20]|uniref:MFS transporter n=1 Tax=Paragemmobacter amnigenus TaxID=2852097 RepID=A0ABS6J260_9RHOB|nr:MFS transporter [Rhodobacter amnigenus]MBU9697321.1 MFS transporter [Rhodobacter amnigenus]MBV4388548.1 MFS transporter [Rhodobacter amnigenus]